MSAMDKESFPNGALIAAGALVIASLTVTAAGRLIRLNAPPAPPVAGVAAQSIEVRFLDEADGSVMVRDSKTDKVVAQLQPGTNGFIRGVMRGLARERRGLHIGSAPPFRITAWRDGRLGLEDTATGRQIDLDAFGVGNRQAFVDLLRPQGGAS